MKLRAGKTERRVQSSYPPSKFFHVYIIANEPAEGRPSAGEAAENSAARRMAYAKKISIGIEKCKCKV